MSNRAERAERLLKSGGVLLSHNQIALLQALATFAKADRMSQQFSRLYVP
jgi:hypothetical protein